MSEIKLEVGKTYRTRDGRKAKCVYVNAATARCLCIGLEPQDMSIWYKCDGTVLDLWDSSHDIIAEWHEPQYAWLNVYECPDGTLWLSAPHDSRNRADNSPCDSRVSRIKVELKRGVWDE